MLYELGTEDLLQAGNGQKARLHGSAHPTFWFAIVTREILQSLRFLVFQIIISRPFIHARKRFPRPLILNTAHHG